MKSEDRLMEFSIYLIVDKWQKLGDQNDPNRQFNQGL